MDDCYLKEWDTTISDVSKEKYVILKETAFYPRGGGVEWDTGTLTDESGETFKIIYTGKLSGTISHEVDRKGLKPGDRVHCMLDWKRRYQLMKYHTAAHVISGIFFNNYQIKVTGNQLTTEKGRIDLDMEDMDVELIKDAINKSNDVIKKDLPVKIYYISRNDAERDETLFKLAMQFPHDIQTIRIVDIKGFDRQADGGCHVKSLKEIGTIHFNNAISKGKHFKRVYFTLD